MAEVREQTISGRAAETTDARAHVFLQPISAPSILGLYGFAGATLMVGAHMAGWFGGPEVLLMPFAAFFGGLAQFLAGMWAFKARDGLATAIHSMWGSFWMGYGLLYVLAAAHTVTLPTGAFPELGWWFIVLFWITAVGAIGAIAINLGIFMVLAPLTVASALAAAGSYTNAGGVLGAAGWIFVFSAIMAWYTASAMMLEYSYQRPILPIGKKIGAKISREREKVSIGAGEPGVMHGQ